MKKLVCVVAFFVLIGSASLFAKTYDLGSGLVLTEYSNGSYGLEDTVRGICYDISIQREYNDTFSVRAGKWVREKITLSAIKSAISYVLTQAGMAAGRAAIGAGAIVNIFNPSPAY